MTRTVAVPLRIIFQLLLVLVAIFLADILQDKVAFIPEFIVQLPEVDYTRRDFHTVIVYFLAVYAVLFTLQTVWLGGWRPGSAPSTVQQLYGLAAGFAVSAILIFITSAIAFDPNFIVGIAVLTAALFLLVFLVASWMEDTSWWSNVGALCTGMVRRLFTVSGVLIVLLAVSPGIMAKLYVSDRAFANYVTQIRIWFSHSDQSGYVLVNALGGRLFTQPMMVRSDPVDAARLYVLERHGRVLVLDYPGGGEAQVVLDIRDEVGDVESENGALGLAFHPQFGQPESPSAGDFFLYYTSVHDGQQVNRLSRFTVGETAAVTAQSEVPLMQLPREPSGFHNGGTLEFGADGFLYMAIGEGVHPKGARDQSQTLRGGILRIDVDCAASARSRPPSRQPAAGKTANYCIPLDNPFLHVDELMEEYWAIGLRNPYRGAFDQNTGWFWVGDVGSTQWEEINVVRAGGNYQFPFIEGYEPTTIARPSQVWGTEREPLYAYVHTAYDRAVVGGFVYAGEQFPALKGRYIFADNYSSRVFSMPATGQRVDAVEPVVTANQYAQRGTSSLTQLGNGDILLTTLGRSGAATGEVLRLVPDDAATGPLPAPAATGTDAPVTAQEIRELYVANCARCHGLAGDGQGPDAGLLQVPLPDFRSPQYQSAVDFETMRRVIVEGGPAANLSPLMPSWGHLLTDDEVVGLIRLIRQFDPNNESDQGAG
ncbi:MAG: PQQ-dependent sugar dehydrogenase [Halioglobus sp.]|nr:PQQ-dependent sugar dehydrogenase [Halioglobus sp.]